MRMRKKQAIVTGCTGGIGRATTELLLREGWSVVGLGTKWTETQAKAAYKNHPVFDYVQGNIADRNVREALVARALSHGQIDALVNVAGVAPKVRADLLDMTEESYDCVMDINLKGTLFLTQLVAREMIGNPYSDGIRGAICNISSLSAYTSSTSRGEYCISKAGVSMVTSLFADRLAAYDIPVNEVRPGIIATGMTEAVKEKYDTLIGEGLLPIKRWGQPEDIAKGVYALISGALPYVTGHSLDIDGGFHMRRL